MGLRLRIMSGRGRCKCQRGPAKAAPGMIIGIRGGLPMTGELF